MDSEKSMKMINNRMEHGGDIYRNKVAMDYSINVNPLGTPDRVMEAISESILYADRYPDPICENAKNAISEELGVNVENIICGNGASEIILFVCRMIKDRLTADKGADGEEQEIKALVTAPGFIGYAQALKSVKADVHYYNIREEEDFSVGMDIVSMIETVRPHLMFVTNPGNPTGRIIDSHVMRSIVNKCMECGTFLAIDECFIELTKFAEQSYIHKCNKNMIVIRALTKSFSIPGLRFGYAICGSSEVANHLEAIMPEWNVSLPAQMACVAIMKENNHLVKSRDIICVEREYMTEELRKLGIKVYPSDVNFLLVYTPVNLYDLLLKERILIRKCDKFRGLGEGYYRIAIKQRSGNEVLIGKIREIINEQD